MKTFYKHTVNVNGASFVAAACNTRPHASTASVLDASLPTQVLANVPEKIQENSPRPKMGLEPDHRSHCLCAFAQ